MGYLFLGFGVVIGAVGHGFTKLLANSLQFSSMAGFVLCYGLGFLAMREGLKTIPFTIAIPAFAAGMVVASAAVGYLWFRESPSHGQLVSYSIILAGVALLITVNVKGW
jgi:multidrug transporter EmrE-like cation transporter